MRRATGFCVLAPAPATLGNCKQEGLMPELVPRLPIPEEPLLLDELNHRIVNEFASLIAIVSRAAAASGNDDVKRALSGVAQLLHHYAQVHRALRSPDQETLVNAEGYLGSLCRSISRSKLDHMNIDLVLAARPLLLESVRCWRLGMIVTELITNAARHAFAGGPGEIRVELVRTGAFVRCTVSDNGSASANVQPGRGSRIVDQLVKELNGSSELKFGFAGTTVTVVFPYGEPKEGGFEDEGPMGGEERRSLRTGRAAIS
jgi:two-component sensor histidine kinase